MNISGSFEIVLHTILTADLPDYGEVEHDVQRKVRLYWDIKANVVGIYSAELEYWVNNLQGWAPCPLPDAHVLGFLEGKLQEQYDRERYAEVRQVDVDHFVRRCTNCED